MQKNENANDSHLPLTAKKNPGSRSHPGDDQKTKTIIKSAASSSAAEKSVIGFTYQTV